MSNVGTLSARAELLGGKATESGLDAVSRAADKAAKSTENLNNTYSKTGAAAASFSRSSKTVGSSLSGIGRDSEAVATRLTGLTAAFGGFAAGATAIRLVEMADNFNLLQKRVELMAGSAELGSAAFAQLMQTSNAVGTSITGTAGMFTRFNGVVLAMGGGQETTLKLVDTLTKALAVQGVSAREGTASLQQLAQALSSGKLAGDEFRSMMENAPYLMQQLAKNLGVTTGELRKMSMAGELTSKVVMDSFLNLSTSINKSFEQIPMTAARGFEELKNSFAKNLDQFNDANKVTQTLGETFSTVAKNMDMVFGAAQIAALGLFAKGVGNASASLMGKAAASGAAARASAEEATRGVDVARSNVNIAATASGAAIATERKALASMQASVVEKEAALNSLRATHEDTLAVERNAQARLDAANKDLNNTSAVVQGSDAVAKARQRVADAEANLSTAVTSSSARVEESRKRVETATKALTTAENEYAAQSGHVQKTQQQYEQSTNRLNEAQGKLKDTTHATSLVTRGAGAALSFIGGPIGATILALGGLAMWWSKVADEATNAARKQKEAAQISSEAMAQIASGQSVIGMQTQLKNEASALDDVNKAQERYNKLTAARKTNTAFVAGGFYGDAKQLETGIAAAEQELVLKQKTYALQVKQTSLAQKTIADNATAEGNTLRTTFGNPITGNREAIQPLSDVVKARKKIDEQTSDIAYYAKNKYHTYEVTVSDAKAKAEKGIADAGGDIKSPQSQSIIDDTVAAAIKDREEAIASASKKAGRAGAQAANLVDAYNTRMEEELAIKEALASENYNLAKSESEYNEAKAKNKDLAFLKTNKIDENSPKGVAFLTRTAENRAAALDAERYRDQVKEQVAAENELAKAFSESHKALLLYRQEQTTAYDTKDMTDYQKSLYAVKVAMEELNDVRTKQIFGSDTDYKAAQNAAQDKVNKAQASVGMQGVGALKSTSDFFKGLPENADKTAKTEEETRFKQANDALKVLAEDRKVGAAELNAWLEEEKRRHLRVISDLESNSTNKQLSAFSAFGDSMGSLISNMNTNREQEDRKGLAAQKAFALSSAMINMYLGISDALKDSGPLGWIKAAGAAAAGAANIANIKAISARNGGDLPNEITQATLHPRELVLPRGIADRVRGMADVNEMIKNDEFGSGSGGGSVTIINQTTGRIDSTQETKLSNGERAIIIKETQQQMVGSLSDPNSPLSKGLQRNYNTQRSR